MSNRRRDLDRDSGFWILDFGFPGHDRGGFCLSGILLILLLGMLSVTPAVAAVTKEQVKGVSGDLICYCGCANKVVATCGCSTADQIEADIKAQLKAGKSKEEIIAAYVAQHGEVGLATPKPTGFNITAWIMPIVALLIGGVVVRTVVVRWRERGRVEAVQSGPDTASEHPSEQDVKHQQRIMRELDELE
jgi:cytochrome c-type biogenesis protein CcmH/NrfF